MKHDWAKIPLIAKELGVSTKTIYNWVSVGKLFMPQAGYVSQFEAYEVWLQQKAMRKVNSYFNAVQGTTRDPNGRFKSKRQPVEESGD